MDSESTMVSLGFTPVCVLDVPDLVNLIADFCDDELLSKISRVLPIVFNYIRLTKM